MPVESVRTLQKRRTGGRKFQIVGDATVGAVLRGAGAAALL